VARLLGVVIATAAIICTVFYARNANLADPDPSNNDGSDKDKQDPGETEIPGSSPTPAPAPSPAPAPVAPSSKLYTLGIVNPTISRSATEDVGIGAVMAHITSGGEYRVYFVQHGMLGAASTQSFELGATEALTSLRILLQLQRCV